MLNHAQLVIVLTSHSIKDEVGQDGGKDLLDESICLQYLGRLRHTKWFQAKAVVLPSCVLIIRVLRDFCERVPTWKPLPQWALELLVERALSAGKCTSPGEALRSVFECVASGILLPGGCGLHDPCEKIPTDATGCMSVQQKEDITNSAQHALRMISFGQIHRVLGIDPLPSTATQRKRPHAEGAAAATSVTGIATKTAQTGPESGGGLESH